jgi:hypothetical protein
MMSAPKSKDLKKKSFCMLNPTSFKAFLSLYVIHVLMYKDDSMAMCLLTIPEMQEVRTTQGLKDVVRHWVIEWERWEKVTID